MKEIIEQAFPICTINRCVSTENALYFEIFDPASNDNTAQGKCYIVYEKDTGYFQVNNEHGKKIHFSAVDGCIFTDNIHKKCDFILFDDTIFCFGDIKNVQTKNRKLARKDAKAQLETTIAIFQEKIDLSPFQIKAIIALTFQQSYPIAKVSTQDAKIRFEDRFKAELYEGNSVNF